MSRNYKHTVLVDGNTLNFKFPQNWESLSQRQLKSVLVFLSTYDLTTALLRTTLFFANCVLVEHRDTHTKCRIATNKGVIELSLSAEDITALTDAMRWVLNPGIVPVLLEEHGGKKCINHLLHGVPFSTYIQLDNLFQGYLISENSNAIASMANIIYPGTANAKLQAYEKFAITQWFVQLKGHFKEKFPTLFKSGGGTPSSVREAMDTQIRALTGGDITKEEQVLACDTWRALTELEAKAREAEDFKKKMKN